MNRVERLPSRYQPYLWVVGEGVETLPVDELVGQRYRVVAPCLWLDTQPDQRPETPDLLPEVALPYLKAHGLRLHVPGLYGVLERTLAKPILLLDNAPIHPQTGEIFPTLEAALFGAPPLRQANWLWQLWQLWENLADYGLARSLLVPHNLRVEGWRIRLLELRPDAPSPDRQALIPVVRSLLAPLHLSISQPLGKLLEEWAAGDRDIADLEGALNQILLSQAARVPTRLSLAGATAIGPTQPRNEDACWPEGHTLTSGPEGGLQVGIVCDGVGGHEGGEVASQLAVQSLKLQLQTLLAETEQEAQLLPPRVIAQQIEAIIRIVNDLINFQNDNQGRVGRQRMGTTLVMAVVIPQHVQTNEGWRRVNEVYLAHVGDSRAYWITPDYCHLLTVDDDIAGREVMAGRQTLALAQERSDAGALTQALGTRGSDHLVPHIQRLVLDETGILLLCSDGLSDHYRIEDAWANYIGLIIKDIVTLESAVASWIELANQKNGHDNTAVVLLQHKCLTPTETLPEEEQPRPDRFPPRGATLYGETTDSEEVVPAPVAAQPTRGLPLWVLAVTGIALLAAGVSWWLMTRPTPVPGPPPNPPTETTPSP
ncbi:MAG TPA: protein phosphatase 2C domain-containing protein [Leptolyngbyaceae cyanobacterium M65_K2018_010]|nr:protein phosphatase 2C domain-containing protein [Leptolyngbyaceae cyanobacterium M65_K2018_010]